MPLKSVFSMRNHYAMNFYNSLNISRSILSRFSHFVLDFNERERELYSIQCSLTNCSRKNGVSKEMQSFNDLLPRQAQWWSFGTCPVKKIHPLSLRHGINVICVCVCICIQAMQSFLNFFFFVSVMNH